MEQRFILETKLFLCVKSIREVRIAHSTLDAEAENKPAKRPPCEYHFRGRLAREQVVIREFNRKRPEG
jgi:hypothetical protein